MSGDMLAGVVDLLGLGPQAKYSTNGWHNSVAPSATVAPRYAMPVPNTMSSGGGSTEPAMFGQLAAALLGTPAAANGPALTSSVSAAPTSIDKAATSTNPNAPGNSIATPDAENAVPSMAPAAASSQAPASSNAAAAPPGSMGDGSMADELAALGPLGALLGLGSPAIESSSGFSSTAPPVEDASSSASQAPAPTTAEDAPVQSSSAAPASSSSMDLMGALGLGGVLAFGDNHVHESPSAISTISQPTKAVAPSGAARRQEGPPGGEGYPNPVAEAMATAIPDMDFHDDMASILYMASYAVPEPTHAPGGEGAPAENAQAPSGGEGAPSENSQSPSGGEGPPSEESQAPPSGEGSGSGAPVDKTNVEPSNEGSSQEKNPYEGSEKKSAKAEHAAAPASFGRRQAPAGAGAVNAAPASFAAAKPSNAYEVLSAADSQSSAVAFSTVAAPSGYVHKNISSVHAMSSVAPKTITITVVPIYTATSSSQHAPVWPHSISNITYSSTANVSRPTAVAPTNASKPTTVPTDSSAANVSVFMGSIAIGLVFSIMCLI